MVLRSVVLSMVLVFLGAQAWAGSWRTLSAGGMSIELYVPTTAPRLADQRALMISLHGCAQTNTVLRDHGNWQATADDYGMVVALPAVPDGGKIAGCWDYYGRAAPFQPPPPPHTRESRDNDNLLDLVKALQADASLNIDPDQVYITGLSSGGGQTMVMGCLASEIFAGIGINAGPTLGTGSHEINPPDPLPLPITLDEAKALCQNLAGDHWPAFATQLTSVIYGPNDRIVDPRYNQLNAEVKAALYEASDRSGFAVNALPGHNPRGVGELWSDGTGPRVSLIRSDGLGHAWPAGSGPGGESNFVAREGVNYPAYVTQFFFENNRRVQKIEPPSVSATAEVKDLQVTIRGLASAAEDAAIEKLTYEIAGLIKDYSEGPTSVPLSPEGDFTFTTGPLPDDNAYRAIVTAIDNQGASSEAVVLFDVGNPPHPPVIEQVFVTVDGHCVAIHGTVTDADGDLERVEVRISEREPQQATLNEEAWALEDVCGLSVGAHTVVVKAVDAQGHESAPVTERFTIAPPYQEVTDTLTGHVSARRIRFYPGAGFGAADRPYSDLLRQHGVAQAFPLYGFEGQWYADPAALLNNTFEAIRIRTLLTEELTHALGREEVTVQQFGLPPAQAAAVAGGRMEQFTLDQLLRMLSRAGMTVSLPVDTAE